jgi:hypothetical protein
MFLPCILLQGGVGGGLLDSRLVGVSGGLGDEAAGL